MLRICPTCRSNPRPPRACVLSVLLLAAIFPFTSASAQDLAQDEPKGDPDSARIVTEDVERFWQVYDNAAPEELAARLQTDYLDVGTPGLADFLVRRIESAESLAATVNAHRKYFASARASTLKVVEFERQIREAFRKLEELYPDAVFPNVYFVIGRMNSGGTTGPSGLLIGTEMYGRTPDMPEDELGDWHRAVLASVEKLPYIVAHELIHYQQNEPQPPSLLAMSLGEGAADFVAELISGRHINQHVHDWAAPRRQELWTEFREKMLGQDFKGWLYDGDQADGRPADLGYWMGYEIVRAFYDRADDKTDALRQILQMEDAEAFFAASGYSP